MTIALISAVLFGMISPLSLDLPTGMRAGRFALTEECVLVALLPEATPSYEHKSELLQEAADEIAVKTGKPVYLTQDLLTYMILTRMEKRGADDYERQNLASRIAHLADSAYWAEPKERVAS